MVLAPIVVEVNPAACWSGVLVSVTAVTGLQQVVNLIVGVHCVSPLGSGLAVADGALIYLIDAVDECEHGGKRRAKGVDGYSAGSVQLELVKAAWSCRKTLLLLSG